MDKPFETYRNTDGQYVHIFHDPHPPDPRERMDPFGTIVAKHPRYDLSDGDAEFTADEVNAFVLWGAGKHTQALLEFHPYGDCADLVGLIASLTSGVVLPLYLLDHSGIALSTRPFGDPWDSGQVGFTYVTAEKLKAEGVDREQGIRNLVAEIEEFGNYVNGSVFGYIVTDHEDFEGCSHEEQHDACWGFYGTDWQENGLYEHAGWPAEED